MFFTLSKIFNFLFSPFTYIFFLLVWALITKKQQLRRKLIVIDLILIFSFGNSFVFEEIYRFWEVPINESARINEYDYGVILGGMIHYDAKNDVTRFNGNADRLLQALPLIRQQKIKQLIFSGGSGDIYHPENKESLLIKKYFNSVKIPTDNFLWEQNSRNTYENARFSAEIIKKNDANWKNKKILLITSSGHMRRSLACFQKQDLKVDYLATNRYSGPRHFEFDHLLIPQITVLKNWNHLAHEIIGYFSYWMTGKL